MKMEIRMKMNECCKKTAEKIFEDVENLKFIYEYKPINYTIHEGVKQLQKLKKKWIENAEQT